MGNKMTKKKTGNSKEIRQSLGLDSFPENFEFCGRKFEMFDHNNEDHRGLLKFLRDPQYPLHSAQFEAHLEDLREGGVLNGFDIKGDFLFTLWAPRSFSGKQKEMFESVSLIEIYDQVNGISVDFVCPSYVVVSERDLQARLIRRLVD